MYKLEIPQEQMKTLYVLKSRFACPSIIQQVREAISDYTKKKQSEFGAEIGDLNQALEEHEKDAENL